MEVREREREMNSIGDIRSTYPSLPLIPSESFLFPLTRRSKEGGETLEHTSETRLGGGEGEGKSGYSVMIHIGEYILVQDKGPREGSSKWTIIIAHGIPYYGGKQVGKRVGSIVLYHFIFQVVRNMKKGARLDIMLGAHNQME